MVEETFLYVQAESLNRDGTEDEIKFPLFYLK